MSFNCMDCGKKFPLKEYLEEVDDKSLEQISLRPCNRV
jgi:DNA-directed RNA polymerase subunit RPC12/RpoP